MNCQNCGRPGVAANLPLCVACDDAVKKAPKMADDINNALEHSGVKLRFKQEHVRAALLANAKSGNKSGD